MFYKLLRYERWLAMNAFASLRLCVSVAIVASVLSLPAATRSQEQRTANEAADAPAAADALSVEQARLADRFKRLEEVVGRLAELSASTDPRRARLLREAVARSREQDINVRFETIVELLEEERLSVASTNQTELQKELDALLALLLKADRDRELASQRERVRKYLKEVSRLIRLQRGIRARTEGGDELPALNEEQQRLAGETGKLGCDIEATEGEKKASAKEDDNESESGDAKQESAEESAENAEPADGKEPGEPGKQSQNKPSPSEDGEAQPSDGESSERNLSPPSDANQPQGQPGSQGESDESQQPNQPTDPAQRATQRLRAAQQQMQEARKKLDEAQRKGAVDRQREAQKQLEQAKAELERVLRQLREEEMERTLTQLAARFRKMLQMQTVVYEGTQRLDRVPQVQRDHDDEIEAARLARQQSQIVQDADRALLLLRDDGTSVALMVVVGQMREDMQQVAERLAAAKVDAITQGLEQDVIGTLEEIIAALEEELKDLEKRRTPPGQQPSAGQPVEEPLVKKLAELKMIRALQVRIYQRTQRYGQMIEGEQAETPELLDALKDLAERQQHAHKAAIDLAQGRND